MGTQETTNQLTDTKDNFLLDLYNKGKANILVSGDKVLLREASELNTVWWHSESLNYLIAFSSLRSHLISQISTLYALRSTLYALRSTLTSHISQLTTHDSWLTFHISYLTSFLNFCLFPFVFCLESDFFLLSSAYGPHKTINKKRYDT